MKYLKILAVILFVSNSLIAQKESTYYIQIKSDFAYSIEKDRISGLKIMSNVNSIDNIFNSSNIKEFVRVFPENQNWKNEIHYVVCYNENLVEELNTREFKQFIPLIEKLCDPVSLSGDVPNDPYYTMGYLKHLDLIKASEAWTIAKNYPKVNVVIDDIDFGTGHEDFSFTLVGGSNTATGGHGVIVAGALGAINNNGIGISSTGGYNTNLYASAIRSDMEVLRLAQAGYRVINCSWSYCTYSMMSEAFYDEIRNVYNTVVICGAGNGNNYCNANKVYPASYKSCVSVTSVGYNDRGTLDEDGVARNWKDVHEYEIGNPNSTHQHNDAVDICAPGYCIWATAYPDTYCNIWGTSISAPQVSGVAAMILSINPDLTANQVVDILKQTSDASIYDIPENAPYIGLLGAGRLDAYAAVLAAKATLPRVDLLIRDDTKDNGTEPNPNSIKWNSPDIWMVDLQQNPITNNLFRNMTSCYVAVKIKNVGSVASTGQEKLHLYWSKSTVGSMWNSSWTGTDPSLSGEITNPVGLNIPVLQAGAESPPLYVLWNLPDYVIANNNSPLSPFAVMKLNWGFSILARIDDGNITYGLTDALPTRTFAQNSNNVAVSNGNLLLYQEAFDQTMLLETSEAVLKDKFTIRFNQILTGKDFKLNDFAEVYAVLSNDLMQKLNIQQSKDIKISDENRVLLTSANSELHFMPLDRGSKYFIGAEVHFISDKMSELNEFNFDMTFSAKDQPAETMRFTAVRDADVYFKALAEANKQKIVRNKEAVTLTSNLISDEAEYTWYNEAGEQVGIGDQITLNPSKSQTYKVEILKKDDGFKSYDQVAVAAVDGVIKSLSPNPAQSNVAVNYLLSDNATNASIQISNINGNILTSVPLLTTQEVQNISLAGFMPGSYIVKLIINGAVADSKSLIIQ